MPGTGGDSVPGGSRALMGSMDYFIPDEEQDFEEYLERMDAFLAFNAITDEKMKVNAFITLAGPVCLRALKAAIHPEKVLNKTYKDIIATLKEKFAPKKSVVAESYKFYERKQADDETVTEYATQLQIMAQSCKFDQFLNRALRDRFVCGVRDSHIRSRLLDQDKSFEETVQVAVNVELTQKNVEMMSNSSTDNTATLAKVGKFKRARDSSKGYPSKAKRSRSPRKCFKCGEWGFHIAADCTARGGRSKREKNQGVKQVQSSEDDSEEESEDLQKKIHHMRLGALLKEPKLTGQPKVKIEQEFVSMGTVSMVGGHGEAIADDGDVDVPEYIELSVEGKTVSMEIDSGACNSILHQKDYEKKFRSLKLQPHRAKLKVVTGQPVEILGKIIVSVMVCYKNGNSKMFPDLPLIIISSKNRFTPLCGRNWLAIFFPQWRIGFHYDKVQPIASIQRDLNAKRCSVLWEFRGVFDSSDTTPIKDFEANIVLKPDARPIFHKAYTVPFGIRDEVKRELDILVATGVLFPVKYSRWASPIVVVKKKNGKLRLCVNCKATINRFVELAHYPLPRVDECFLPLRGCTIFCIIDLAGAYQQVLVAIESRELLTINTPWGLFQFHRLIFGLNSSPAIFQSIMDQILKGIPQVMCYIDDILIGGKDKKDCERILRLVLERLAKYNVKANVSKCLFFQEELEYLGHRITKFGVQPVPGKLRAIVEARAPTDLTELKSYLGMLNYYGRFVSNLSGRLTPLYELTKKDVPFQWTEAQENCFQESKTWLTEEAVLTHYQSDKPLVISVDASGKGVGAVLSHIIEGKEKPIMFASSTLSTAEKGYSIVELEALSLVFAVKTFHKYIYGREVTVFTDHSSLKELFGTTKYQSSAVAAARIARWGILLSMYSLKICHKKGIRNGNADFLSRFPQKNKTNVPGNEISFVDIVGKVPLCEQHIRDESEKDELIQEIIRLVKQGFPKLCSENIKPFQRVKNGLTVKNKILYLSNRIVVPEKLRAEVLKVLHAGHEGIVRVKSVARGCCWWPRIDLDIENTIKSCDICQELAPPPRDVNLIPWEKSGKPFNRVHIDFFHLNGKTYLLLVDEYSRYIHVKLMGKTDAGAVIKFLRDVFFTFGYGLPKKVASDNGPPFGSKELGKFWIENDIKHITSPPYHPSSNGLAERAVKTVKMGLKKCFKDEQYKTLPLEVKLQNYLFRYNNIPTAVEGVAPMSRILAYTPRTTLQIMNPQTTEVPRKERKACKEEKERDDGGEEGSKTDGRKAHEKPQSKPFEVGDDIMYFTNGCWLRGVVLKRISKVVYSLRVRNTVIKGHRDQIKKYFPKGDAGVSTTNVDRSNPSTSTADTSTSTDAAASTPRSSEDFMGFSSEDDEVFFSPVHKTPPARQLRPRNQTTSYKY